MIHVFKKIDTYDSPEEYVDGVLEILYYGLGRTTYIHPKLQKIAVDLYEEMNQFSDFWLNNIKNFKDCVLPLKILFIYKIIGVDIFHLKLKNIKYFLKKVISFDEIDPKSEEFFYCVLFIYWKSRKIEDYVSEYKMTAQDSYTPRKHLRELEIISGGFTLDVTGNPISRKYVHPVFYYSRYVDALKESWFGDIICNPPYKNDEDVSVIGDWLEKTKEEIENNNIDSIIIILPHIQKPRWQKQYEELCKLENTLRLELLKKFMIVEKLKHDPSYPISTFYDKEIFYFGPRCKYIVEELNALDIQIKK